MFNADFRTKPFTAERLYDAFCRAVNTPITITIEAESKLPPKIHVTIKTGRVIIPNTVLISSITLDVYCPMFISAAALTSSRRETSCPSIIEVEKTTAKSCNCLSP